MEKEVEIENNLAENEIYCNGFTYTVGKPSEESIEQLRFIKQVRKEQQLKEPLGEDNKYIKEIKEKLVIVPKVRGYKRIKAITEITENFIELLKWMNKEEFNKKDIKSFFNETTDKSEVREIQIITKQIIEFLERRGTIKKDKKQEHCYTFRNRFLYSNDYGSFDLLMKHNGYKYSEETGCWTSTIPQAKQGCYSNGNTSVFRERLDYQTENYILI